MQPTTLHAVRCVEGCGGGEPTAAYIGLVVAFLSLAVALAAWRVSHRSLQIARDEHRVFLKQINARADFDLTIDIVDRHLPDDGAIESSEEEIELKWQLGIENSGDKAALSALINFLVPTDISASLAWITQNGLSVPDPHRQHGPMSTAEELPAADGTRHPAHYLVKEVPRISLRGARVGFATAQIKTPANPGEERIVPVSFRVESDDLPDDVEDRRIELETTIRRIPTDS
jgi:hypothetical protein